MNSITNGFFNNTLVDVAAGDFSPVTVVAINTNVAANTQVNVGAPPLYPSFLSGQLPVF